MTTHTDLHAQASNVITSWASGKTTTAKMASVLRSFPWATPVHSADWVEVADVPVTTGPDLNGILALLMARKTITGSQADEIYRAVAL